ncbi:hypothetical protein [Coleofasciculus sp. H7-2]|uniref:hypothetical protein n=1 Tax=Coleofasciculus sp. H7-2 TaxID=3351545 RepID=UPI003672519B
MFEQAEAIAREMKISRSAVVAIALEEFIRRRIGIVPLGEKSNGKIVVASTDN